ncbi:MAG: amino acid ABC transporter permease [Proteobacteria bacterium]|nr:amino acid ABC transporter permease [Pseudomonadota bacterium]
MRLRRLFFNSPGSTLTTLLLGTISVLLGWQFLRWALVQAVFSTGAAGPEACRAPGVGACWAVVGDKLRLILFGSYPFDQQWRAALAMVVLLAALALSAWPRLWRPGLALLWMLALAAFGVLMHGGMFGLPVVGDDQWGGLPVTLLLAAMGLAAGFPLAVALAVLRHSAQAGVARALAVAYIELVRAVPLLAVLFLVSVMIPLFLPQGMDLSKLLRVFVAFAGFTAAYLAEVIRGGLQAVPRGQAEAAMALGLTRWTTLSTVLLPQALRAVQPALVNVFIAFFKATSIVVVVGIFDLMTAAKRAAADAQWQGFGTEIYLFVAAIYFVFCWAMSRYSAWLQRR